jgi:hypothetical protein
LLTTKGILIASIAFAATATPLLAVEGALGRTLPGVWIQPQGAVVGPTSGFSFTMLPIGYMGSIGGGRLVPIGGALFADVQASVNLNYLVPQYVYKTETNKVNFASSFMGVVGWLGVDASLNVNNFSRSASSANAGIGDVILVPLTVGIHLSENSNLAISTMIFAPTGQFQPAYLSNLGMGEWTVMPNFAYTYLWKKRGLEFDSFAGFDIYGKKQYHQLHQRHHVPLGRHGDAVSLAEICIGRHRFQYDADQQRHRAGSKHPAWLPGPRIGRRRHYHVCRQSAEAGHRPSTSLGQ